MRILAFDSTAVAASVCLLEDKKIVGEFFINTKLTHSRTLMPMAQALLQAVDVPLESVDCFAVAHGPGSFTGVRIGVSTVKGLAMPQDTSCFPVSTLLSMAYNLPDANGLVCAVMDARCHQVYNAMFRVQDGVVTRLCEDRALSIDDLAAECKTCGEEIILVGDGAALCSRDAAFAGVDVTLAPEARQQQRASSVALAAKAALDRGEKPLPPAELAPLYLRLPQAERELRARTLKK